MFKKLTISLFFSVCLLLGILFSSSKNSEISHLPLAVVKRENLKVEIKTIGELEAARSIVVTSSIKGDQGKIIDLVSDGIYVQEGDVLVRLDSTPFEEKIYKLKTKIKEQESYCLSLKQSLDWEKTQAEHKNRTAQYEFEAAELELNKLLYGDGPQETSRLKGMMQKSLQKFEELNGYSSDLLELQKEGFLNIVEVKQAEKKLAEEREGFDLAKMQYESYIQHVLPMQIKKGETNVKKAQVNLEETLKSGEYNIAKAYLLLEQARQEKDETLQELKEAKNELAQTEIIAPTPGMVVLREDYRSGQRRKPRIGDILIKNQPLLDLPDLSQMIVKTRVRETELHKIGIGRNATIEVDAYPDLTFTGKISSIGVLALGEGEASNQDKYFEIRITLDQSDSHLRPGMTTRTTIHAQEALDALTLPIYAIFEHNREAFCYVCSASKKIEKQSVKLGISNNQSVEIREGLQEGTSVTLLNPYVLK